MNPAGNRMMAAGVLRRFGMEEEQIGKLRESWAAVAE
jgi:hypothetical protein